MTRVIAVANNKGGVAKTTTAGNLAYGLSQKLMQDGEPTGRVLVVDLDTQGNQADFFGVRDRIYHEQANPDGACLSNLLNDPSCATSEFIISTDRTDEGYPRPNLFLVPATRELGFSVENIAAIDSVNAYQASISRGRKRLTVQRQLDSVLSSRFGRIAHNFDFIIIDCPPNLDALKAAVYNFADEVIVPVKTDRLSAIGAEQHTNDIINIIREKGIDIKISFIVPTMMRTRQILAEDTLKMLQKRYGDQRVSQPIPESVHVKEGPAAGGISLFEYAPSSKPALAYMDLVNKVFEHSA